jgi:hypothetical protein
MRTSAALVALVLLAACKREESSTTTASATPASSAPVAAPAEKPKPWYVGAWTGSYQSVPRRVEMKKSEGLLKEWAEDDGGVATGEGKVTLRIDEAGSVEGESKGALGDLVASGEVDENTLRVRLKPADLAAQHALSGVLLAEKQGAAFAGTMKASTGDSLVVREATIKLEKSAGAGSVE